MSAPATTNDSFAAPVTKGRVNAEDSEFALLGVLQPLASLKLTVVLMALAIVVIFIGTLAQTTADIWEVMRDYFRAWIMWVPLEIFFPRAFFPRAENYFSPSLKFPFPGGATVGILMALNLFAAHLVRFKTLGKGQAALIGWGIMGVGGLLTLLVVLAGNLTSLQDTPLIGWGWMWAGMLILLAITCAASWCGAAYVLMSGTQNDVRLATALGLSGLAVVTSALLGYAVMYPEQARLAESSLRILWQQTQGLIAGAVVLGGAWFVFRQRAGVVVLHAGIALLMLEQVLVAWLAVESQITLVEGESANFSRDVRSTELAFIDSSDPKDDQVTVVSQNALLHSVRNNSVLKDDQLPAYVRVLKYYNNSSMRRSTEKDTNLATAGSGLSWIAEEAKASTGVDNESGVDMGAAYVTLTDKQTDKDLGTFLVSVVGTEVGEPETVEIDGKKYALALRFKHLNKPYTVTLTDVRKDDYPGTDTPMNYSSDVVLEDTARNIKLTPHIWMNNPLRYGGETFYQSGFAKTPQGERTTLQVVSNTGWMIPYVALSYVGIGMLFHFALVAVRFLDRQSRERVLAEKHATRKGDRAATRNPFAERVELPPPSSDRKGKKGKDAPASPVPTQRSYTWLNFVGPVVVALLFLAFIGRIAREPKPVGGEFDYASFGRLPIVHEGRVKPIDTFARNELRIISNEESFKEFADEAAFREGKYKRQPAVKWLLDVISGNDKSFDHRVFRIENQEVLSFFNVPLRPGFFRYSANELQAKIREFDQQLANSRNRPPETLTVYEKKMVELNNRLKAYITVTAAFDPPRLPPFPTEAEMKNDPQGAQQRWLGELRQTFEMTNDRITQMKLPLVIPLEGKGAEATAKEGWQAYPTAYMMALVQKQLINEDPDQGVVLFNEILDAYAKNDPRLFNQKVAEYQGTIVNKRQPTMYSASKVGLESYFNQTSPFFWCIWIYIVALILSSAGLLTSILGDKSVRWSATTLIVLAFALHTAAILGRLYISGRPPVTNLYSSAVFIGWGCVLLGLGIEFVFRLGVGNIVSAIAGFVTLWIAYWLAVDGDTFTVLQAVLDTQFWLATHVTSITIGYSATFLAGLLGICLLVAAAVMGRSREGEEIVRLLGKMVYGVVCFALFFSFVGTVLGGLWADDSWGRFWGWDPKENGALMIVLWNALVLHARWDKIVGDRGLAILAIGGNIVTAWSWFGVNELGAGLHSYGFTEGRAFWLGIVVLIHLAIIAAGTVLAIVQRKPTGKGTLSPT